MVVYLVVLVVFVVSEIVSTTYGPLVIQPEAAGRAYYFNVLAVSASVGFGLFYYKNSSVTARDDLDAAHRQITDLLENMLPPSIATRLQHGSTSSPTATARRRSCSPT